MKEVMKYVVGIGITALALFVFIYDGQLEVLSQAKAQDLPGVTTPSLNSSVNFSERTANTETERSSQLEPTAAELADIDPASIDWAAIRLSRGAKGHFDPMIRSDLVGILESYNFSDEEIAAYNKLHVVPFNPVAEKVCSQVNDGAGTNQTAVDGSVTECIFQRQFLEPFSTVPDEHLIQLAVNDPLAAAVLARRVNDEQDQFIWTAQAIALSGKSGPALWMAEYNYISDEIVDSTGVRSPLYDSIIKRYSLESLAFDLGDPRANPKKYETLISSSFGDDSDQIREYAQTQILRDRINEIRRQAALPEIIWERNNV